MLIFRDNDNENIRNINPGDIGYTYFAKTFSFSRFINFLGFLIIQFLKSILYSTLSINYDGNVQRLPNSNNTSST